MNIYVMRHGTTIWNEKGITQGRSNNRLSKSGIELTKQTANLLKPIHFDIIFCSPLFRTVQTANLINEYHKIIINKDNHLIEIDQGIFTGRHKDSLTNQEKQLKIERSKICGMESYEEVYIRTLNFINELKKEKYNNVLIVTHNLNASLIELILTNQDFYKVKKEAYKTFKNAQFKKFII